MPSQALERVQDKASEIVRSIVLALDFLSSVAEGARPGYDCSMPPWFALQRDGEVEDHSVEPLNPI